ncbi:putative WRKY transcription factor 12 [Hibiscus syriacus]|uniref:WRKY transcription factor 12 n=1 Tax=Hibiscus syriacus TaxID=106335 RepID=A0A6A3CK72_HIBSY|nr:probable WRKY transcription factor 50 [Hibiscus syriacus]KAE8727811.1 putative WRKY transcription factor 12 [Hibiscus syriacus]
MELNSEHFLLLPQPETASTTLSPVNPGGRACVDYTLQTNEGYATTMEGKVKIAFRTKSGVEVMDDGYKWRKYGKKMIKDNPNPRHYYRCSRAGCKVKKRVERDREDGRFVITTYEGRHNHETPHSSPPYN